jgi:hypothetical protein
VTVWLPFVTLVLGAALSLILNNYIRRPKLVLVGGGSGGIEQGCSRSQIRIENAPGLLGINVGETLIFGRRLLPPIRWGIPVERNTARECIAWIHDLPNRQALTVLWWDVDGKAVQRINLDTTESAPMNVLARRLDDPTRYFVFNPEVGSAMVARVPDDNIKWHGDRDFLIRVGYSRGQTLTLHMTVRMNYHGQLECRVNGGGGGI